MSEPQEGRNRFRPVIEPLSDVLLFHLLEDVLASDEESWTDFDEMVAAEVVNRWRCVMRQRQRSAEAIARAKIVAS